MEVNWFDNECAEIVCDCGLEQTISNFAEHKCPECEIVWQLVEEVRRIE